ncbi:D-xylose ABC transporter ATP-binding protein [Amphibiibacter pelophylacis]|uniref:D-xylose ABC transporter ATP-binding protein n=1 Tax=Amphibiibacter pelophylacis TaxID=1799477 RepID=A0ACC6P4C2_9BURK
MTSELLLEMEGITKSFGAMKALSDIYLRVHAGECVGLCGENGAGKSTLMKVLSAVYPHGTWEGSIRWKGQPLEAQSVRETEAAGIVIIHQELMLVPDLSVTENIFLGHEITRSGGRMDYETMHRRADELVRRLRIPDINVRQPISAYGGGHQQLIEIAKALNKNAKLLILDEPSSSLTSSEIAVLLDIVRDLKSQGVGCVYISHKLDEVAAVCDTIAVIRDGHHVATTPMRDMNTTAIITQMVGREITQLYPQMPHETGEVILEAHHITCHDIDMPSRLCVSDISFSVRRGEILGVAGLVGAGRTELMQAIFGAYPGRSEGEVLIDGKPLNHRTPQRSIQAGLCMVPEDRKMHGIIPDFSVGRNITLAILTQLARAGHINGQSEQQAVAEQISRLQIKTSSPALSITGLSGGNQQKAILAKMLLAQPRILILDEPTRGVDVGAKYEIYKLMLELAQQGVAIIMVSSELPEVLGLSDRVLVIGEGRLRGNFERQGLTQEKILAAAISSEDTARYLDHVVTV